jgi:hypothetical protein
MSKTNWARNRLPRARHDEHPAPHMLYRAYDRGSTTGTLCDARTHPEIIGPICSQGIVQVPSDDADSGCRHDPGTHPENYRASRQSSSGNVRQRRHASPSGTVRKLSCYERVGWVASSPGPYLKCPFPRAEAAHRFEGGFVRGPW